MKPKSFWKDTVKVNEVRKLESSREVDVLIIGGGLAGMSTAYELMDSNLKTMLIEKDVCGFGISSLTTAKITFMQDLIYDKLSKTFSNKKAYLYYKASMDAINIAKDTVKKYNINCNLTSTDAYVFTNDENKISKFKKEEEFYQRNSIRYCVTNKLPINYPSKYAIKTYGSAVFHPVKYILSLKEVVRNKIDIYENTRAIGVDKEDDKYVVKTLDGNIIRSKYVVMACHYPFFLIPGMIPIRTSVEKSYIAMGEVDKVYNFQAISNGNPTHSIRFHADKGKKYVIYGRCSHNACDNLDASKRYAEIESDYKKHFGKKPDYLFQNHDIMSMDGIPLIGRINKSNPNLIIICGFSKWGMSNSIIGGKIISDIIQNKNNPYIELFDPGRGINKDKIINSFVYNYHNAKGMIPNKIKSNKSFYKYDVKIVHKNGHKYGVYTDEKAVEHVVNNICPHMKCNLIFNYKDKTWDCPCHQSRFDIDGNNINGPSVFDIKVNEE